MTHEWHPADGAGKKEEEREMEEDILEQRLKFYYGLELPEQPLPTSSWQQVFSQLASQRRLPKRRRRHLWRPARLRLRRQQTSFSLHSDAQDAFRRILFDVHKTSSQHLLVCRSTARARMPGMHVSCWRRRPLRLTLPIHVDLKPVELDVLLAGGLARYEEMRRPASLLVYVLSTGAIAGLFVWIMAALFLQGLSLFTRSLNTVACILLIGTVLWLLHMHARRLAQRADIVMVRWIGRFRACQGLHALADRSRVPSQRRWGDLSLTERIAHICGTQVTIQEERFTLVR